MARRKIDLKNLDIPPDYFDLNDINKHTVCLVLMDSILRVIDQSFEPQYNRVEILNKILDVSIESNIEDETYEIAAVLSDIKKLLNED
jgi:hypothetical protein